jgi:hypothetical protein
VLESPDLGVDRQSSLVVAVAVLACASLGSAATSAAATLRVATLTDGPARRETCSLREAIATVNSPGRRTGCGTAGRRSNTILLRAGRYALSIAPSGADDDGTGDLDVTGAAPLTIAGAGPRSTVIDARGLGDRVLSVASGASVTLRGLRVTGGRLPSAAACVASEPAGGGGIFNAGTLALDHAAATGNRAAPGAGGCPGGVGGQGGAGGNGGGIYNQGSLSIAASTIYDNRAGPGGPGGSGVTGGPGGPGGLGGGIFTAHGRLSVTDSTIVSNFAGVGGSGGGPTGPGGTGGGGGAVAVTAGSAVLRDATIAENGVGTAGLGGTPGAGGGLFVASQTRARELTLESSIVASNVGGDCSASARTAITDRGHNLVYGDRTCPGRYGNPELGPLQDNGGANETMALGARSAAIDRGPRRPAGCPSEDQRGVRRPEGRACDIGAYEFALPTIAIVSPARDGSYRKGSRVLARFRCDEGGITSAIAACKGTIRRGHPIATGRPGTARFEVTATDKSGNRARISVRYEVFEYVNPVSAVSGLYSRRIDLGVDYGGSGPLRALGDGVVTMATDNDDGPSSCWAISCWPGGGIVVYRLTAGPFAGKYVYTAEHISVTVHPGQRITAGEQIATLYPGYPWVEMGWAAGPGPEALGIADWHQCPCGDPGGWSTIDGRDFDHLLVTVGAPSGWLQGVPNQSMPRGWPTWSG